MKAPFIIKSLVFGIVFAAVMSVSFLVEAHDVPDGVQAYAADPVEFFGPPLPAALPMPMSEVADGLASWYGAQFHGRRTASGTRFDMNEYTAAHRTLPFGSLLRVTNTTTGEAVVVEVTDRGPFIKRRVVDLSKEAARRIGVSVTPVSLDALTPSSIADFYRNNDKTVIVITSSMDVQSRAATAFATISPVDSYTEALNQATAQTVIIVLPDGDGGTEFALGKLHLADVASAE